MMTQLKTGTKLNVNVKKCLYLTALNYEGIHMAWPLTAQHANATEMKMKKLGTDVQITFNSTAV